LSVSFLYGKAESDGRRSVGTPMEPSKKPLNVLTRQMNGYIAIVLKNGIEYRGTMVHCDSYMNIILNGASEYHTDRLLAHYGQVLVRGNNILYIALDVTPKKEAA